MSVKSICTGRNFQISWMTEGKNVYLTIVEILETELGRRDVSSCIPWAWDVAPFKPPLTLITIQQFKILI